MSQRRGYWRESDGSQVTAEESLDTWAACAYELLADTARTYHADITYSELGAEAQKASGISTSVPVRHWIGKVLYRVVREAHRRGDPPLTALVVHSHDGTVGDGYTEVLEVAGEPPIADALDREYHAAEARLRCYRHFGAALPLDGGRAALAPKLREKVARREARRVPQQRPMCPTCFIQLPATGTCDTCGP